MNPLHEDSRPAVIRDEKVRSSCDTNPPLRQLLTASVNRRTAAQRFAATAVLGGLGTALTSKIALAQTRYFAFQRSSGGRQSLGARDLQPTEAQKVAVE